MNEMFDYEQDTLPSEQLRLHADCLHVLTLAPPNALPKERMLRLLCRQLELLERSVLEHFAHEESGGYLSSVVEARPDLKARAVQLKSQHTLLSDELKRLIELAETDRNLTELSDAIAQLIEMFEAHEDAENQIMVAVTAAQAQLNDVSVGA